MESFEKIGEAEPFLDRMSPEHNLRCARMTPKCENEKQFERPRGSKKCPGADQCSGTAVLARVDGAHPHTAKINALMVAAQGKSKGFDIQVVVQSAQNPDLNVDDLAFFTACRQACHSWRRKATSVCLVLYGSFHGVPESGHNYQRHRGGRQAHSSSEELGDLHDQNNRAL